VSGAVETSTDPRFKAGDQVLVTGYDLAWPNDGGYAEYVRVPADWVVPIPPGLGAFDVMALGTAGFTRRCRWVSWNAMVDAEQRCGHRDRRDRRRRSMAVQCLAALGYQVTALTGKGDRARYLRSIGATEGCCRDRWCSEYPAASKRRRGRAPWIRSAARRWRGCFARLRIEARFRLGADRCMDVHTSVAPSSCEA